MTRGHLGTAVGRARKANNGAASAYIDELLSAMFDVASAPPKGEP